MPKTRSAAAFTSGVPVRICLHESINRRFRGGFVFPGVLDDRRLDFRRFDLELRDQDFAHGFLFLLGNRASCLGGVEPIHCRRPRGYAHLGITIADQRNDRVNVGNSQSADLRECVEDRGLEFRIPRGCERINQSLAMLLSGFARLAKALRRRDPNITARVVEEWPNRFRIFCGRLRGKDDRENDSANVWVLVSGIFEHLRDLRFRLRAEPGKKLKRLHPDSLGSCGPEQFRNVSGGRRLTPISQRTHSERGDFIGRVRQRRDRAIYDGRGRLKRTIFERVSLRAGSAAEERGSDDIEEE